RKVPTSKVIPLLGEHDDGSAFRSLVRQRGKLRDIGKMTLFDAGRWKELRGGPVSQSDRSRLVQQQHIYVARGFNSAPRHGDDVPLNHAVHAGNADSGQKTSNGRRKDRKSTRLNSSHVAISYAVFCLKKK